MTQPLIGADDTFALWAAIFALVVFGFWADGQRWSRWFTGLGAMMILSACLSNIGVIPKSADAYGLVWTIFIPLAVPLLLLKADLRAIVREGGRTLIAFAIGVIGTVAGVLIASITINLGEARAELAGIFAATYIGGSMNFAAVAEALEFNEPTALTAAVAADNVATAIVLIVLVSLPASHWLRSRIPLTAPPDEETAPESRPVAATTKTPLMAMTLDVSVSLTIALIVCAAGSTLADWLGVPSYRILFISAIAVALANVMPRQLARLRHDFDLGMILMFLFFVTIGASADVAILVEHGAQYFVFAALLLMVHLGILLSAGRLLRLKLDEIVVASTACALGPGSAAAVAAGKRWEHLVTPGIMCGVLGYALANFIGIALARIMATS